MNMSETDHANRVFARMYARQYCLVDPKSNATDQCCFQAFSTLSFVDVHRVMEESEASG
jgi:hypothetical protein